MKKFTFVLTLLLGCFAALNAQSFTTSPAPSGGRFAENTAWYQIVNARGPIWSVSGSGVDASGNLKDGLTSVTGDDTNAHWCVVGDETNGYQFYNKAKGAGYVLGVQLNSGEGTARTNMYDASSVPTGVSTTFWRATSSKGVEWECFRIDESGTNYFNYRDNYLALWNSDQAVVGWGHSGTGDDGSAFKFTIMNPEVLAYDYYDIVYVGAPEGATPTLSSTQGEVVEVEGVKKLKCSAGTTLVASSITASGIIGMQSTVTISGTTITVTYSTIDMTNAPMQNGLYLINSCLNSSYYLHYNASYPDNLRYGSKTGDTNSYVTVTCIERSGDDYYYTLMVGGKYVYATGYDRSNGNPAAWPKLKTINDLSTLTEYEKWVFEPRTEGGFQIKPNGKNYSFNPWNNTATGDNVGFWDATAAAEQRWTFAPVYPITFNEVGTLPDGNTAAATFSADSNTTLPTGVNAYYSTTSGDGYITLEAATAPLPANEGFILTGTAGVNYVEGTTAEATAISGNLLEPTTGEAIPTTENAYVLAKRDSEVAFYLLSGTDRVVAANKAYLLLNNAMESVKLNFGGEATGIESVETINTNADAPIFDLSGRRVLNAAKGGVYIQNGKKFIVK